MRIGELSRLTSASDRSLRHYESMGLIRSTRAENGYREFPEAALERVRRIQMFLANGFTLEEARLIFPCLESDPVPLCDQAEALYAAKLADVERRIAMLEELRGRLILHLERGKRR